MGRGHEVRWDGEGGAKSKKRKKKHFEDPGCLSRIPDPDFYLSRISDPGSQILDPGSRIPDPGSRIPDPGSWIPDPGYRIPDLKTATIERGEKN